MNISRISLSSKVRKLSRLDRNARRSYAQCGEDLVLNHLLFEFFKLDNFSYLDIGSANPIKINNTYLFYKQGFRGVCVDASPELADLYSIARPNDLFVHAGVTVENEQLLDFYMMSARELNTFDKEEAESLVAEYNYQIEQVYKIKTRSINSIINEYCKSVPELISIDIEGLDFDILKSLDYSKYRPKIIIAEMAGYDKLKENESQAMADFMKNHKYLWWGNVGYSSIFLDTDC